MVPAARPRRSCRSRRRDGNHALNNKGILSQVAQNPWLNPATPGAVNLRLTVSGSCVRLVKLRTVPQLRGVPFIKMRVAVNLNMFHPELPLLQRYKAAAAAGFRQVEVSVPYSEKAEDLKSTADSLGLSHTLINAPP
ncbi:hypothetical protein ANCDUO_22815, partial [Ancylostoma duodenale]